MKEVKSAQRILPSKRKTYYGIIPLSSKVEKYQKIVNKKIEKHGFCNTILIERLFDNYIAILLQNAFPTLEKYIDHVHTIDGKAAKVPETLCKKISQNFSDLIKLKERGINLFFTDIDKLKNQMLDELNK